jgi:hypothetical protein
VKIVLDYLSRLDNYSLKIQEEKEEALTILSGSETSITSNSNLLIPIHISLIFKEKSKVKDTR